MSIESTFVPKLPREPSPLRLAGVVFLAWLLASGVASPRAEDDKAEDDGSKASDEESVITESVVVRGQKIERTREEVGESVSIVTGEQIEASTDTDLYDVVLTTPNVDQAFGEKGFVIRGIDQRGAGGSGTGLLINTIVDGATLHFNQATFFGPYSAWDLEQVEIYRGAQSTQQGRNALAGAIVVQGAEPRLDERFGKFRVSGQERGGVQLAAAINTPIIEDELAFRFAFERRERDGWVDNPTRDEDDYDFRDSTMYRGKLRYTPNERFSAGLTIHYTDTAGGEDIIRLDRFPDERRNFSDEPAEEGSIHRIVSADVRQRLTDTWSIVSETSTYDTDYRRFEDGDLGPDPGARLFRTGGGDNWTQELRFQHESSRLRATVGAFYGDFETDLEAGGVFPGERFGLPSPSTLSLAFGDEQESENYAIFGDADFEIDTRWSIQAGLRYDNETLEVLSTSEVSVEPSLIPTDRVETRLEADYDAFLPKIGATYAVTGATDVGVVARRAYRAGGRSNSLIDPDVFNEYDPEFAWTYEAFLRSVSSNGKTRILANLFWVDWTDQQVSVEAGTGAPNDFITVNAGESRTFGAELEWRQVWHRSVSTFVSVGALDTEFTEFASRGEDLTGNEFPYAPSFSAASGVSVVHPTGFRATADVSYKGGFFSDPQNTEVTEIDARTLFNARIGYDWDRWSVSIYGRNLLDEDYLYQKFASNDPDSGDLVVEGRSGEPRTVGLTVDFRF